MKQQLQQSTDTEDSFSTGLFATEGGDIKISSRDNANTTQSPIMIIQHSYESHDLTYDANGNLVQGFGKSLEYDSWHRLIKVSEDSAGGAVIAEYTYDHEGNRIKKIEYRNGNQSDNETTYYFNSRPADFVQVRNASGIFNYTYIYFNEKLIASKFQNGQMIYYHSDHLGSTTLITNQSGEVVDYIVYMPYGEIYQGDEGSSRFLFTAKELDKSTDFYYYGARYYDPKFSRFLQADDPAFTDVFNPQNLNPYSYVLNNPYKYVDPSGNEPVTYTLIESGLDIISLAINAIVYATNPDSNVNKLALALDATDLVSGPISNPLPSGLSYRLGVQIAKDATKKLAVSGGIEALRYSEEKINSLKDNPMTQTTSNNNLVNSKEKEKKFPSSYSTITSNPGLSFLNTYGKTSMKDCSGCVQISSQGYRFYLSQNDYKRYQDLFKNRNSNNKDTQNIQNQNKKPNTPTGG